MTAPLSVLSCPQGTGTSCPEDSLPFTLQSSFSATSSPFLQHIVCNSTASRLCVSSSARSLLFFDPFTFSLTSEIPLAHESQITNLSFFSTSPHLLASSSQDGTVRVWDCRAPSSALSSSSALSFSPACVRSLRVAPAGSTEAEVWTVSLNSSDTLVATSAKNVCWLFDLRGGLNSSSPSFSSSSGVSAEPSVRSEATRGRRKRGKDRRAGFGPQNALARVEAHSDTVTSLLFHPTVEHLLFSGGEDQLVCVYDLTKGNWNSPSSSASLSPSPSSPSSSAPCALSAAEGMHVESDDLPDEEEDRTMVACFSHGRPVKQLSVLGPEDDCLCVTSPMEDVALWHLAGLSRKFAGPCREREAEMETDADCMQSENVGWHIEKKADWLQLRNHPSLVVGDSAGCIIDSFYEHASGRLFLLAGSVEGNLLLFHANLDGLIPAAPFAVPSTGCGHAGLVRDATTIPSCSVPPHLSFPPGSPFTSFLVVTCGEDGRLCAWKQELAEEDSLFAPAKQKRLHIRNHRWPKGAGRDARNGDNNLRANLGRCAPY
uniref:WD domain, G-beta repeat-containing protein n=1 Tax=Toxoplasma gondii COUG TaxID=1074873 RepID=A0A2G8XZL6_TOXGO|nr:WD domain, G-beta repeat-containing protein [Toxoplasma gondii COUG]